MQEYICLALPGWSNDAEMMKKFTEQLGKALKQILKIECLEPPYDVSQSIASLPDWVGVPRIEGRTLYRWGDKYIDHTEDLQKLRDRIVSDPKIIGVMGFSHGAFLVGELGQMANTDEQLRKKLKILFAFSSNGIKPEWKIYQKKKLIKIPTIQTIGTRDPLQMESLFQSTEYLNPLIIYTDATHRIPIFSHDELKLIVQFVQSQLQNPKL